MNFFNFLTQSSSVLNFNLSNIVNGFGLTNSSLEMNTSKTINTEQMVNKPNTLEMGISKSINEPQKETIKKETQVELLAQQQQLINQYMHLNIQLLSKKLENLQQIEKVPKIEESQQHPEVKSNKKKIKKMNSCGHQDKQHYAKGMCSNCYHKYGRTKKPWNCPHEKLYANGMCQNCYINTYNRKRRQERDEKNEDVQVQSELKIEENIDE